jgi:hypothetical protein
MFGRREVDPELQCGAQVGGKGVDARRRRIPRTHETHTGGADETVEPPSLRLHGINGRLRQVDEHAVGLDGRQHSRPGKIGDRRGES